MSYWLNNKIMVESLRVNNVRSRIENIKLMELKEDEPLTSWAFGQRSDPKWSIEYSIEKKENRWLDRSIGAIILNRGSTKSDPMIRAYLAIKISSRTYMEGIITHNDNRTFAFYHNGSYFGSLVETPDEVEKPTSLWQKLFRGKRKWKVYIGEMFYGEIWLQYPYFTYKKQLFFRMQNGIELPISTSHRGNVACGGATECVPFQGLFRWLTGSSNLVQIHGDMIIPLNTPKYADSGYNDDVERMHFLLNVVFRTYYIRGDF